LQQSGREASISRNIAPIYVTEIAHMNTEASDLPKRAATEEYQTIIYYLISTSSD
jgi:hypothetical protein